MLELLKLVIFVVGAFLTLCGAGVVAGAGGTVLAAGVLMVTFAVAARS